MIRSPCCLVVNHHPSSLALEFLLFLNPFCFPLCVDASFWIMYVYGLCHPLGLRLYVYLLSFLLLLWLICVQFDVYQTSNLMFFFSFPFLLLVGAWNNDHLLTSDSRTDSEEPYLVYRSFIFFRVLSELLWLDDMVIYSTMIRMKNVTTVNGRGYLCSYAAIAWM